MHSRLLQWSKSSASFFEPIGYAHCFCFVFFRQGLDLVLAGLIKALYSP